MKVNKMKKKEYCIVLFSFFFLREKFYNQFLPQRLTFLQKYKTLLDKCRILEFFSKNRIGIQSNSLLKRDFESFKL